MIHSIKWDPDPGHACWLVKKAEVFDIVSGWAATSASESAQSSLKSFAAEEPLKEMTVWGLTAAALVGGRGAYMKAPAPPQLVVFVLPGDVNVIQRIACCPETDPVLATDILCGWIVSMLPKRCNIMAAGHDAAALGLDMERLKRVALT